MANEKTRASSTEDASETSHEHDRELLLPQLDIERRDFMKAGAVAGAMGGLAGCTGLLDRDDETVAADTDHQVPPGELDEYYAFLSGGHSGDVRVLGLPSMREIMRIPVFNAGEGARGYGHDDESREMLEEAGGYG